MLIVAITKCLAEVYHNFVIYWQLVLTIDTMFFACLVCRIVLIASQNLYLIPPNCQLPFNMSTILNSFTISIIIPITFDDFKISNMVDYFCKYQEHVDRILEIHMKSSIQQTRRLGHIIDLSDQIMFPRTHVIVVHTCTRSKATKNYNTKTYIFVPAFIFEFQWFWH